MSNSGQIGGNITLCTPVRERPFPSFLLCVSAQVAPPLSPIEIVPLLNLYQYSACDVTSQLFSWKGGGATDLKNPSPYYCMGKDFLMNAENKHTCVSFFTTCIVFLLYLDDVTNAY